MLRKREDNQIGFIFAHSIYKPFICNHYMTKYYEGITTAMSKRTVENQIRNNGLSGADAARLVLECVEELGERAVGMPRLELLALVRRVLRAGVAAVQAEENTVTFEHAAWASVEARSGRRPTTTRDLRHYVRRMLRVEGVAKLPLRGMTTAQCRRILQNAFGHTVHGFRKGGRFCTVFLCMECGRSGAIQIRWHALGAGCVPTYLCQLSCSVFPKFTGAANRDGTP